MNFDHPHISGLQLDAEAPASVYAVLSAAVVHAGGLKRAGAVLWPALPIDRAARKLRDCLSPDRRECLHPHEVVRLLGLAREAGWHGGMAWVCSAAGYGTRAQADDQADEAAHALAAAAVDLERAQQQVAHAAARAAHLARLVAVGSAAQRVVSGARLN